MIVYFLGFVIRTVILFCFIYEFVLAAIPYSLFSSRKIAFVIMGGYFIVKRYSLHPLFSNKLYRKLLYSFLFCCIYVSILYFLHIGIGSSAVGWFVYFPIYSIIGSFLCAGFFDWNYEELIKSIAIVTIFQAFWCILTFYNFEIRLLNESLFIIEEDANIDFLVESRVRSIGGAGASLSIILAFSSFSFLYFILKGKKIFVNSCFYIVCAFATFLVGTTGMLIFLASLSCVLLSITKRKRNIIFIIFIFFSFSFFISETSKFMDIDKYDNLTYKMNDFFTNADQSGTMLSLSYQKVPPISFETIIGTGLSRGRTFSGLICTHDGGYYRTYFGLGLIMTILFYVILYLTMYRMLNRKNINFSMRLLLLTYLIMCVIIEYKEPFMFRYIPFLLFAIYCLKIQEDSGYNILKNQRNR